RGHWIVQKSLRGEKVASGARFFLRLPKNPHLPPPDQARRLGSIELRRNLKRNSHPHRMGYLDHLPQTSYGPGAAGFATHDRGEEVVDRTIQRDVRRRAVLQHGRYE